MNRRFVFPFALGSLGLFIALAACSGDDDVVPQTLPPAQNVQDAGSSSGGSSSGGSSSGGSSSSGTPSALTSCTECMSGECGSQILSCMQDEKCRALLQCAVQNDCFSDPMACLTACNGSASGGAPDPDTLGQLLGMAQMVQTCGPCAESCGDVLEGFSSSSGGSSSGGSSSGGSSSGGSSSGGSSSGG